MKLAMRDIFCQLDIKRARMIWTVHDELIIEATDGYVHTASAIMKSCMEKAAQQLLPVMGTNVKVVVNVSQCYNK
jgi:DNA polymerase I-like protein with 3'-5' exonuclease and polymerase domains